MTTTVIVTTPEHLEQERILFRLSSMVDTVRDTAAGLLMSHRGNPAVGPVLNTLRGRYNAIHDQVLTASDEEAAARLSQWLEPLHEESDLSEIYAAAAALAGFLDLEFQADTWLANRMQNNSMVAQFMAGEGAQMTGPAGPPPSSPGGQYL